MVPMFMPIEASQLEQRRSGGPMAPQHLRLRKPLAPRVVI